MLGDRTLGGLEDRWSVLLDARLLGRETSVGGKTIGGASTGRSTASTLKVLVPLATASGLVGGDNSPVDNRLMNDALFLVLLTFPSDPIEPLVPSKSIFSASSSVTSCRKGLLLLTGELGLELLEPFPRAKCGRGGCKSASGGEDADFGVVEGKSRWRRSCRGASYVGEFGVEVRYSSCMS